MLDLNIFAQLVIAAVVGGIVKDSIRPVATGLKKSIKMLAKKIAD